ncbi:MAG: sialidase family protein [Thermoplasmatota archaeon]
MIWGEWSHALFLTAVLLAGCAHQDPTPLHSPSTGPAVAPLAFGEPRSVITGCCRYEPTVAVDGAGRIFVTVGSTAVTSGSADTAVSADEGATWKLVQAPPLPDGAPAFDRQGDGVVQASPSGRMYFSALTFSGAGGADGVQVAWTDDGGSTWTNGAYQNLGQSVVDPDRQWLAFGPGNTVYATYQQPCHQACLPLHAGRWIAHSDDGGSHWSPWSQSGPAGAASPSQVGAPVVDPTGRLLVAACTAGTVAVYSSTDKGVTWTTKGASSLACTTGGGLDLLGAMLVRSWRDSSAKATFIASSGDEGQAWGLAQRWGNDSVAGWWTNVRQTNLTLAYFHTDGDSVSLHVAKGGLNGVSMDAVVTSGLRAPPGSSSRNNANTDFATLATLPSGKLVTAWTDVNTVFVAVSNAQ